MSRSYRHTSICGITTAASEKDDKRRWHRCFRQRNCHRVRQGTEPLPLAAVPYAAFLLQKFWPVATIIASPSQTAPVWVQGYACNHYSPQVKVDARVPLSSRC
jgi:hypothetical protein